jgi:glycerophosphoryl diester phosphodiesterase
MVKRFRKLRVFLVVLLLFAAFVYLSNASWLVDPLDGQPYLVAHRGLAQDFSREGLTGKTCTAARWLPSGHDYLENTLPSMAAAFEFDADAVELDIHRTADHRLAVFHDWTVACRTEGSGAISEHTLAELQQLDVGHGYTGDDGRTWPYRGKGVGMLPSLEQVLAAFPERDLVIDIKSNERETGALLAEQLATFGADREGEILVFGGPVPVAAVLERLPHLRTITRPRLKQCLKGYLAWGWSGHLPAACERGFITVPANVAPWLWGWPNRFLQRMHDAGSRVVLLGDYGGEGFSSGWDDPERVAELPAGYAGGIWTNRIDRIGPAVRGHSPDR